MANTGVSQEIGSIMEVLLNRFERLTPTERKPARVLLENYPLAGLNTVARFAEKSDVSGPTILRLVSKLGFSSYPDFQNKLRQELQARLETPSQKDPGRRQKNISGQHFNAQFSDTVCQNIRESMSSIPASEISAVTALLENLGRSVYLIGGRYTMVMAQHFYLHLHAIRPRVVYIDGQPSTWSDHLLDLKKDDLLIIFDIRRYQADIVTFAAKALKRGARIILFTDQWFSPIAGIAHHVFALRTEIPSNWDSSTAIMTLVDLILARLTKNLWPEVRDRLEAREKNFQGI